MILITVFLSKNILIFKEKDFTGIWINNLMPQSLSNVLKIPTNFLD